MARVDTINMLYSTKKSPLEFQFDSLMAPPIISLIPPQAIAELNRIATSLKLSSKVNEKYKMINAIMRQLNFRKLGAGTNRVVYAHYELTNIVVKVAVDIVGLKGSIAEFNNQELLKPFVTKCFDVTPCGTIGMFERVQPIIHQMEFLHIADDIFDLLFSKIVGKYILEDIGTKFFMNWGIREGFGPCLLDYPNVFHLDNNKLYCRKQLNPADPNSPVCNGEIDYDEGFNGLVCNKCNSMYFAKQLSKAIEEKSILIKGDDLRMKVTFKTRDGKTITSNSTDTFVKPESDKKFKSNNSDLKVKFTPKQKFTAEQHAKNMLADIKAERDKVMNESQTVVPQQEKPVMETKTFVVNMNTVNKVEESIKVDTLAAKHDPNVPEENVIVSTDKIKLFNDFNNFINTNFDFSKYQYADSVQRTDMINLLVNNSNTLIADLSKFTTKSIYDIIVEFVDTNYEFEETSVTTNNNTIYSESGTDITPDSVEMSEDEEQFPNEYSEYDEKDHAYKAIRTKNRSLDDY